MKIKVRRPTEETALGAIARQANRLGITQYELLSRTTEKHFSKAMVCHCMYCRRKRQKDLSFRVTLEPTKSFIQV